MGSVCKVPRVQWPDHSGQGQGSLRRGSRASILFQLQWEGLGVDGN